VYYDHMKRSDLAYSNYGRFFEIQVTIRRGRRFPHWCQML